MGLRVVVLETEGDDAVANEAQSVSEELLGAMSELTKDAQATVAHIRSGFNRNHEVLSKVRSAADAVGSQFTELDDFCTELLGGLGGNAAKPTVDHGGGGGPAPVVIGNVADRVGG